MQKYRYSLPDDQISADTMKIDWDDLNLGKINDILEIFSEFDVPPVTQLAKTFNSMIIEICDDMFRISHGF